MIARREKLAWSAVFGLCILAWWLTLTPAPYRDVEPRRVERVADEIELVAAFEKTDCTFTRLSVIAGIAGETVFLPWRDIEAPEGIGDRTVGKQTLRIAFTTPPSIYDWIEVRTQHLCDGETVNGVFYRIEPVI